MKITQVMLSRGFGGAERLFVDLSLSLAERGVTVQSICHEDFSRRQDLDAHPGVRVDPVSVRGNRDFLGGRAIRRSLSAFSPDLIHSHLARGALYSGRVARKLAIPLVANLHNYVDLKYYRRVDAFLPGTEDQRQYLMDNGVDGRCIHVVPHYTRVSATVDGGAGETGHRFVALGRMVAKKGFDVLLHAFARVCETAPDATLILGGDGPERLSLEQLAGALGIADAVTFFGWVDDVPAFLSQGEIFVLPSLDEPFGIVTLEAMACRKAIIATRTAGPMEVLDDSTAILVGISDVADLAKAMGDLLLDKKRCQDFAGNAFRVFADKYSEERVLPVFLNVYQQVCAVGRTVKEERGE